MLDLLDRQATDNATATVLVDGVALPGTVTVMRIDIRHELNCISSATVVVDDGDVASQTFAVSSGELLLPGKAIEIQLGYQAENETAFRGLITRQRVRVKRRGNTMLVVECRDATYKMTLAPHSRDFSDVTDSDVFEQLISDHGLAADLLPTTELHEAVVQFQVTDWDFMLPRIERMGMICATDGGTVKVMPLPTAATPVVPVVFGQGVFDADLEMDADSQPGQVTTHAWDMAGQALLTGQSSESATPGPGNLDGSTLAASSGADALALRHGGSVSQARLDAWANAALAWRRLARIRGTVQIQGTLGVAPADLVDLGGFGDRFSGSGLVTGIAHRYADGDWLTTLQIGVRPQWHHERFSINALPGDGAVRPAPGLYTGVVTQLQDDPGGEQRVQVRIPVIDESEAGVWARLASLDAGDSRGFVFRPEIGDEVVVGGLSDDPDHPVILGMLHSSAKPSPIEASDDNHEKGYVSRAGIRWVFNDDEVTATLETPNGNMLVLTDADGAVRITDENDNSVTLNGDGIALESARDIKITATGDVSIEGVNISLSASAGLTLEGSSEAGLSSSGSTTVKGSIVQIN